MRGLSGRVVLVAGGAGGIGTATCVRLGEEGASVVVADLDGDAAASVAADIREAGGTAEPTSIDLRDEESVAAAVELAVKAFGGLDVLHANAADLSPDTIGQDSDIESVPLEVFDRTIAEPARAPALRAPRRSEAPRARWRGARFHQLGRGLRG